MRVSCGCGHVLVGAHAILAHVAASGHTVELRGTLSRATPFSIQRDLMLLSRYGSFRAACGCGFVSCDPSKALKHAAKGHQVQYVLRLTKPQLLGGAEKSRPRLPLGAAGGASYGR